MKWKNLDDMKKECDKALKRIDKLEKEKTKLEQECLVAGVQACFAKAAIELEVFGLLGLAKYLGAVKCRR